MDFQQPISIPTLPLNVTNFRQEIEDHIVDLLGKEYSDVFTIEKYYETANRSIYEDSTNLISSGVPAYMIRTKGENIEIANGEDLLDDVTSNIEVLIVAPVGIEKNIKNVSRYVYTMNYLLRELLRSNPITGLPKNRRRPFLYAGNRDIFRDKDIDIILATYQVDYVII